jgi:hypothetical protein
MRSAVRFPGDRTSTIPEVRIGIIILPDLRWNQAARRWRSAEELGFTHAWTYDHLGWRDLVGGPWFDPVRTLAAAAGAGFTHASTHWPRPARWQDPAPQQRALGGGPCRRGQQVDARG